MFRRKTQPASTAPQPAKPGGKGRPTPSRKEAEAAARARAKVPRTRKEQIKAERAKRTESSRTIRQAMKDGDERYFLERDKGPVRRFIRDFVDTRFSFVELTVPVMLVTLVLGYSGNESLARMGNLVLVGMFLLIVVDVITLRFRLRRELARRFPDQSLKGTTWYSLSRAMQMRFMRLPKPQVKIGQQLPEYYR